MFKIEINIFLLIIIEFKSLLKIEFKLNVYFE